MRSVEELRAESRRLRDAVRTLSDPVLKRQLAGRAVELATQAEIIERSSLSAKALRQSIARYRAMLMTGIDDGQRQIVREMLDDLEELLAGLPS